MNQSKQCSICECDKLISNFAKKSASSDGLRSWCKVCVTDYSREGKLKGSFIGLAEILRQRHKNAKLKPF